LDYLPAVNGGSRNDLYRDGLALIQDYPVIGGGLNMFMMLHATYALLLHVGFSVHSHNMYLDLAIAQGLPGLFALLWIWVVFVMILLQAGKLTGELWDKVANRGGWPFVAAAMSLTVLATHGLLDDALYGTRASLLLFIPPAFSVSMLARLPQEQLIFGEAPVSRPVIRLANLAAGGVFLAVLLLILIVPRWRSNLISNLAAVRQSQVEMGTYSWPEWPIQDELRRQLDVGQSISGFERALALNPDNVSANRRLGMIELSLGEYEDALIHLQAAYAGASWDNASRQLLGEALIANGQVTDGAALWQSVNIAQRQLGVRLFWYQYIGDEQRVAWLEEGIVLGEKGP
jgi:tetratricopeptide (TPR) repeat protein